LAHVRWLVRHFAGGHVVDPFSGCGTTGLACKLQGWPCTLIEIEERFCEIAAKRLEQEVFAFAKEEWDSKGQETHTGVVPFVHNNQTQKQE
jgi:site-specific DNA-methyltransferase (adenine-specific)